MSAEKALVRSGLVLPSLPAAGGNYLSALTVGPLVYLAGVISRDTTGILTGVAGDDRSIEEGRYAARCCALVQLAVLRAHLGSLDAVRRIVSVNGYVRCAPDFGDAPSILDGASDLLFEVFGEAGRHVRAAIGVNGLPRQALVEMQMIVERHP